MNAEIKSRNNEIGERKALEPDELQLRHRLGIPPDAQHVLIFGESSHWDPNWLETSEEYYRRFVERIIDKLIEWLTREPRRVFSIESVFFLRMYWERRPEQRPRLSALINDGRLRLSNPAVTTADTLIPNPESILRDFLIGQEWLRTNGLDSEPKLAYFPDSFGASPALPSLLQAAGFEQAGITRIDGMYFPSLAVNHPSIYPRHGSSAERLLKEERTLDFVWRDRSGAEVLCHWNAFSYGQGDLLAYRGISRVYLFPFAVADRSEHNIAGKVRRYANQLTPLSRTPYLFCPIGMDFISPIPHLVALLDRYNYRRYPETGIWTVSAGLEDYLDLVNFHRGQLPVIELDPNPYWSGFYASRPALKARCHELVEELLLVEQLSCLPENARAAGLLNGQLAPAWWTAAVSNHHDFITGTSPDRTVELEQSPWLEQAKGTAEAALDQLARPNSKPHPLGNSETAPSWSHHGNLLRIETSYFQIEMDEDQGGAITRAQSTSSKQDLLHGISNDLLSYRNTGGLWQMGHEFTGGIRKLHRKASDRATEFQIEERNGRLLVHWLSVLDGEPIQRSAEFAPDSPIINFKLSGRAAKRRTITVSFVAGLQADRLTMDMPGGVVTRPREKLLSPTFWPFQHFIHMVDQANGRGLAAFQRWPGAASYGPDQTLELVALRNAVHERAFWLFPVSGHPASGYEKEVHTFQYAVKFSTEGDWTENALPAIANRLLQDEWGDPHTQQARRRTEGMLQFGRPDVWVIANKPASRGGGRVVRLQTFLARGQPVEIKCSDCQLTAAFLCDARERDLAPLTIVDGAVMLTMPGSIASVRLIT